ncbi:MAG: PilN domain-containing protein [Pseudomonadales bacterium]|nr:PilN domain-containing protein [Pseudomonadales bacterium]
MADIKINLLPWREELREQRKKEFLNVLVGVIVFAGVIIFAVDRFYNAEIDTQISRNNFLTAEIKTLEDKIQEIQLLQQKRNELLSRMKVIQELQGNRPIIVRVFDELARKLAERVFYTSVTYQNKQVEITGVAESNNRISSQLRNFAESDWFDKPNVTAIKAEPAYGPQASEFQLQVEQTTPAAKKEVEQ